MECCYVPVLSLGLLANALSQLWYTGVEHLVATYLHSRKPSKVPTSLVSLMVSPTMKSRLLWFPELFDGLHHEQPSADPLSVLSTCIVSISMG